MKAEIRSLGSTDVNFDTYRPAANECFAIPLEIGIGPVGEPGAEMFSVMVVSLAWLKNKTEVHGPISLLHHIVVAEWNPIAIRKLLDEIVERQFALDWPTLGATLSRFAHWEFDNYRA